MIRDILPKDKAQVQTEGLENLSEGYEPLWAALKTEDLEIVKVILSFWYQDDLFLGLLERGGFPAKDKQLLLEALPDIGWDESKVSTALRRRRFVQLSDPEKRRPFDAFITSVTSGDAAAADDAISVAPEFLEGRAYCSSSRGYLVFDHLPMAAAVGCGRPGAVLLLLRCGAPERHLLDLLRYYSEIPVAQRREVRAYLVQSGWVPSAGYWPPEESCDKLETLSQVKPEVYEIRGMAKGTTWTLTTRGTGVGLIASMPNCCANCSGAGPFSRETVVLLWTDINTAKVKLPVCLQCKGKTKFKDGWYLAGDERRFAITGLHPNFCNAFLVNNVARDGTQIWQVAQ